MTRSPLDAIHHLTMKHSDKKKYPPVTRKRAIKQCKDCLEAFEAFFPKTGERERRETRRGQ
jgi:hypothetical protein